MRSSDRPDEPMPLFHFTVRDHDRDDDVEGMEMASVDEARRQGIIFAGEYLRDNPDTITGGRDLSIDVADQDGTMIYSVRITLTAQ